MIKYNLKCHNNHEFESWFSDSTEFNKLNKKKLLECIYCSSKEIEKSIVPEFHINGTYLKNRGIKEGTYIGKILKILEDEWIKNDFKLSDQKVEEIILNYKN